MSDDIQLPSAPAPLVLRRIMPDDHRYGDVRGYTFRQLRIYARAAILADRERRAQPESGAVAYQYLYADPFSGTPVWRDRAGTWNGQQPKESRALFLHPSPADEAVRRDAERYRLIRSGKRLVVVGVVGDDLTGRALDAAADANIEMAANVSAAIAQRGEEQ